MKLHRICYIMCSLRKELQAVYVPVSVHTVSVKHDRGNAHGLSLLSLLNSSRSQNRKALSVRACIIHITTPAWRCTKHQTLRPAWNPREPARCCNISHYHVTCGEIVYSIAESIYCTVGLFINLINMLGGS